MIKKPITNFQEATISLQLLTMATPGRMGKSGEGIVSVTYINDGMWSEPESAPYILVEMHTYPFGDMPRTTKIGAFDTESEALTATIRTLSKCLRCVDADRLEEGVARHDHPYDLRMDGDYDMLYDKVSSDVLEKKRLIEAASSEEERDMLQQQIDDILQQLTSSDEEDASDKEQVSTERQMQKIAQNSTHGAMKS